MTQDKLQAYIAAVLLAAFACDALAPAIAQGLLERFWTDLEARPGGPMSFRFILQPAMAILAALHDGIWDARLGRSPYFWTVLHDPARRGPRLKEGLRSTARILALGLVMDAIYQYRVLGTFYPDEALVTVLVLAFLPYMLLRGPVDRIARRYVGARSKD